MVFYPILCHQRLQFLPWLLLLIETYTLTQNCFMNVDPQLEEMNGKILLLENKKFVYCLSFIGLYYMAFIGFLTHVILQTGGFR